MDTKKVGCTTTRSLYTRLKARFENINYSFIHCFVPPFPNHPPQIHTPPNIYYIDYVVQPSLVFCEFHKYSSTNSHYILKAKDNL